MLKLRIRTLQIIIVCSFALLLFQSIRHDETTLGDALLFLICAFANIAAFIKGRRKLLSGGRED